MNVNDFTDIEVPAGDKLQTIFNHQRDLIDKYHLIEEQNVGHKIPSGAHGPFNGKSWMHAGALNINDRASQLRFKDFAWRITEELTEATLALSEDNEVHYFEELIDALHFSVELMILCGLEPDKSQFGDSLEHLFRISSWHVTGASTSMFRKAVAYNAIEKLGEAMNRLKLKPWKSTAVITDEVAFKKSMLSFFSALIDLLKTSGFTAHSATVMYLQKNAVNQFRQRTNY